MAKAKKGKSSQAAENSEVTLNSDDESTFEQALEELENLVESMESDQAPLGELIENYEKGTRLYGLCQQRLDNAQQRVDLIRNGVDPEEKTLEPFDTKSESLERKAESRANTKTDDGQLF